MRPVIGICSALEHATWGSWSSEAHLLPSEYANAVASAGGIPVLVPPAGDPPLELLDRLDGLVLAGGVDIDPETYGATVRHPTVSSTCPARDRFEVALVRAALERGLPVLGICRGLQLLNVARGGTLVQDLGELLGHQEHRRTPGSFEEADHAVRTEPGTLTATVVGTEAVIKSHHHQALDRIGDGLVVTACSAMDDGIVEAAEIPGGAWALGVQWHPEVTPGDTVIPAFVAAAAAARG